MTVSVSFWIFGGGRGVSSLLPSPKIIIVVLLPVLYISIRPLFIVCFRRSGEGDVYGPPGPRLDGFIVVPQDSSCFMDPYDIQNHCVCPSSELSLPSERVSRWLNFGVM